MVQFNIGGYLHFKQEKYIFGFLSILSQTFQTSTLDSSWDDSLPNMVINGVISLINGLINGQLGL